MDIRIHDPEKPNFVEVSTVQEANKINLDLYRYDEGMSSKRGTWCFKIRERKRNESRTL